MNMAFQPVFLQNSPSTICDQILFMVKNSDLNFQLHETPFSLSLNLKKSFAQHWNRDSIQKSQFSQQNLAQKGPQLAEHVIKPVPQPGLSPEVQPYQPSDIFSASAFKDQEKLDLFRKVESLEAAHKKAGKEHLETLEIYAELDKAHRKLIKENKELQDKHTKTCSEVKVLKNEKKIVLQENNSLSVALKSCKKDSELSSRSLEKQLDIRKAELVKLIEYKTHHQEETKKQKKVEKKLKQKERKNTKSENEIVKPAEVENYFVATAPLSNSFDCLAGIDSSNNIALTNELEYMEDISKVKSEDQVKPMQESDETENLLRKIHKENSPSETNKKVTVEKMTNSSDLDPDKPLDIAIAAPESETKDNVMEMNAEELSKLLDDIITNFRAKQSSM